MATFTSFRTYLAAAGLALLLTACAPTLTYQLRPVSGDVAQINGRTITRVASSDSVVVVASYEREDLQYIALDIEVRNQTNHPLDVDPARFYTLALDAQEQPLTTDPNYERRAADPNREAKQVVVNRVKEQTRLKRAKVLNTVLMVATVVGAAAASSKPQSFEKYVANQVTYNGLFNAIQAKRVIDHTTFADRMQRYDYEAYRWRELAMKPTNLQPGESVRGFVYLPKTPKAAFLQLHYPASGSEEVVILFEQNMPQSR